MEIYYFQPLQNVKCWIAIICVLLIHPPVEQNVGALQDILYLQMEEHALVKKYSTEE